MDPYVGEIRMFAGNFAPKDWAFCNGQLMAIQQNTALFSLLGVQYGGDGKSTFALPNMQGRAPVHQGQGPGLTNRVIGEVDGSSGVTLLSTEMPAHTHVPNSQSSQGVADPSNAVWTSTVGLRGPAYYGVTPNTSMSPLAIQPSGESQPHNNMQPYLGVSYIISLRGVFPQRP